VKILTDSPETKPLLRFQEYSDSIVQLLRAQRNISLAVYGDWGTGKTTLMKSVETKLTENIVDLKSIDSTDKLKLLRYLKKNYNIKWAEDEVKIQSPEHNIICLHNHHDGEIRFLLEDDHEKVRQSGLRS
jgi:ATPase subunit of ABC transporter with duplicated ATPase domains